MLDHLGLVSSLEDVIGFGEGFLDVAFLDDFAGVDVAIAAMDSRRIVPECFQRIEHRLQRLVDDFDFLERIGRELFGDCRYRGDAIAAMPNDIIGQDRLVLQRGSE
jgi:hypothetical protein